MSSPIACPTPCCSRSRISATEPSSANDCFRPVSRYFDRITRPEQIIPALTRAIAVLTDPAECGPVTLAFCQDVQAEAYDYPASFFAERVHRPRRTPPDAHELADAVAALRAAKKPLVISGGGVLYSDAEKQLLAFCEKRGIPIAETQAGKSATPPDHPLHAGAIGVTGTEAANRLAEEADVILAVGTRLADFTTGFVGLVQEPRSGGSSASTCRRSTPPSIARLPLVADARAGIAALDAALGDWRAPAAWTELRDASEARMAARSPRAISPPTNAVNADRRASPWRVACARESRATSSSARRAACRANCTSSGRPAHRSAITSNTAIPAWATRSRAASASSLRIPTAR